MSDDSTIDDTEDWDPGWDDEGGDDRPIRPHAPTAGSVAIALAILIVSFLVLWQGSVYAKKYADSKIPEKPPALVSVTSRNPDGTPNCLHFIVKNGVLQFPPTRVENGPCQ